MMMVGHTHEDIDALFKLIVALWRRQRHVLCPVDFARMLQDAIPSAHVHPFLEYVHDWAEFFADCIYEHLQGITSAREFIMRMRDDGGTELVPVCCVPSLMNPVHAVLACHDGVVLFTCAAVVFWYKPDAAHRHLYPARKDENGNPITVIKDGETEYDVCPNGIEIFRTAEGASGMPSPAAFAMQVKDPSKVRFHLAHVTHKCGLFAFAHVPHECGPFVYASHTGPF